MRKAPLSAADAPVQASSFAFPPEFAARLAGLERRSLSGPFGLTTVGVAVTRIRPGWTSGLHHSHQAREEFVYVLEGEAVLVGDGGVETVVPAGSCVGFRPGIAHHLENRGTVDLVYLDIGAPTPGDRVSFPDDDLAIAEGGFVHKDGRPYG